MKALVNKNYKAFNIELANKNFSQDPMSQMDNYDRTSTRMNIMPNLVNITICQIKSYLGHTHQRQPTLHIRLLASD